MNPAAFFVRRGAFTLVLTLGLLALGVTAWRTIPRSEDPPLRIPVLNVIVSAPGLGPVDLEERVARPLEDAIHELDDLLKLQADIRDGLVRLMVEFRYGTDPDGKYDDVLRQVASVRDRLPTGIRRIEVRKVQTIDVAVLQLALVSDTAGLGTLQDAAEVLRRRLESVPGVRRAEKWAYPPRELRVSVDPERLVGLGVTAEAVASALETANRVLPAGSAEVGSRRFTVGTSGPLRSVAEVAATPVRWTEGGVVRVGDVASVGWELAEADHLGRFKGRPAVFVTVLPQRGENVFRLRDAVMAEAREAAVGLPGGIALEIGFDQSRNVRQRLRRLELDFVFAFALVLLTLLPLGLRAGVLVMVSIPLSLAIGVALLQVCGFNLNQLSIVGFVIALGLLVDDSIVVVENIVRLRREGAGAVAAAIEGTRQVAVPVVGTTAAVLLAFLPLVVLPGGAGQFIRSLPMAVVLTVVASLAVSLTVMPFLASRWLTGAAAADGNPVFRRVERLIHGAYGPWLRRGMDHPWKTLAVAGVLCGATLALVPAIGFSLFPAAGIPQFSVRIHGAEGNSVATTDAIVREVEAILAAEPGVDWWYANVGRGNPQVYYNEMPLETAAATGEVFASLRRWDPEEGPVILARLRARLAELAGARIVLREYQNGPPIEAPIAVRVLGPDRDRLAEWAARVERVLRSTPGTVAVDNPVRRPRTDLDVVVDRDRAAALGVSEGSAEWAARLALAGWNAGRVRGAEGEEFDLVVGFSRGERATLGDWDRIRVPTPAGRRVPLGELATVEMVPAPPLIQRFNRERCITVSSEVAPGANTDRVTREVARQLAALELPPGFRFRFGGEVESREESFAGLGTAILVALVGIAAILVLEFRGLRGAVIVGSVVPLGAAGGLVALYVAGHTLSFTAAVGFIALVGIEIKNSLLLVEFAGQLRETGLPLRAAVERAGEARFLPVVLTAATALGALFPLALAGSAMYSPLAVVLIGGLLSSLVLSRVVTPVLYLLFPPPVASMGDAA